MRIARTLEQALQNAKRIERELPRLIQPSTSDYDIVILKRQVEKLARRIARLNGRTPATGG
jgi:hypothetical protein